MQNTFRYLTFILASAFISNAIAAAGTHVLIDGNQAKKIYNSLTGSEVQQEGAAGHIFRTGKNIACRYTNADMSDKSGKEVGRESLKRFKCAVQIDTNGVTSPSSDFN